jgi:hypothetical protein
VRHSRNEGSRLTFVHVHLRMGAAPRQHTLARPTQTSSAGLFLSESSHADFSLGRADSEIGCVVLPSQWPAPRSRQAGHSHAKPPGPQGKKPGRRWAGCGGPGGTYHSQGGQQAHGHPRLASAFHPLQTTQARSTLPLRPTHDWPPIMAPRSGDKKPPAGNGRPGYTHGRSSRALIGSV